MEPDSFLDGLDLDDLLSSYPKGGVLYLVWSVEDRSVGWASTLPIRSRGPVMVVATLIV